MAGKLDDALRLELEPYEIKLLDHEGERYLCVGPDRIVSQDDLPHDAPSLEELRGKILLALEKARQKHTFTNFVL